MRVKGATIDCRQLFILDFGRGSCQIGLACFSRGNETNRKILASTEYPQNLNVLSRFCSNSTLSQILKELQTFREF